MIENLENLNKEEKEEFLKLQKFLDNIDIDDPNIDNEIDEFIKKEKFNLNFESLLKIYTGGIAL